MATPAADLEPLPASEPIVQPDGRATIVLILFLIALLARVNDHEARIAALEP